MGVGTGGGPSGGGFGGGSSGGWGFGGNTYGGMGGIADSMAGQGSAFGLGYDATGLGNFGSHAAGTKEMGGHVYGGLVGKDRAALMDMQTALAERDLQGRIAEALASAKGMTGGTLDAALGNIGAAHGGNIGAARGLGVSQSSIDAMMDKSVFGGADLSLGGLISSMFGEEKEKGFSNPAKARDALAKSGLAETDEQGNITGPNNAAVFGEVAPLGLMGGTMAQLGARAAFDAAPSNVTGYGGSVADTLGKALGGVIGSSTPVADIAKQGVAAIGRADNVYGGFANAGHGEMAAAPTESYSGSGRASQSGTEGEGGRQPEGSITSVADSSAPSSTERTFSDYYSRFPLNSFFSSPGYRWGYSLLFPSLSQGFA